MEVGYFYASENDLAALKSCNVAIEECFHLAHNNSLPIANNSVLSQAGITIKEIDDFITKLEIIRALIIDNMLGGCYEQFAAELESSKEE